jgi:RNA polymerase sigma factor (sigma-70 family)
MRRDALLRYRAERLMRKDFDGLRSRVLAAVGGRLRTSGASLAQADLDACYCAAWHGLYAAIARGLQIDDVAAWLVLVTYRRAIDECRAQARQRVAEGAQAGVLGGPQSMATVLASDIADELDDRERLRQLMEAFVARLGPRERRVATLCYLHGLTRAQAAHCIGVSEARMRKLMDGSPGRPGVAAKVGALLRNVGAGEWCEQQGSLMRAYALGILDPDGEKQALAREHLRRCPACRALVLALRGLAAALPPLALPTGLSAPSPERAGRPAGLRGARSRALTGVGHGSGSLVPKIVVAGIATLSAGGGYALLSGGTSSTARSQAGHPAREISSSSLPPPSGADNPTGVASTPGRAGRRASRHSGRRARRSSHPADVREARTAARTAKAAISTLPVLHGTTASMSQARTPSGAVHFPSSPSSEFTPERASGGRRGG